MPTTKHKIVGSVTWRAIGGGRIQILDGWQSQNIVKVFIPELRGVPTYGGYCNGNVYWYKGAVGQLVAAWREVGKQGLRSRVKFWDGSFVPRMVRGSTRTPSNHTFGTAFDINARWNGLGVRPPAVGQYGSVRELVPIFEKYGFFWGGNYRNRKDGMHFEIAHLMKAAGITPEPDAPKKHDPPILVLQPWDGILTGAYLADKEWNCPDVSLAHYLGYAAQDPAKHVNVIDAAKEHGWVLDEYTQKLNERGRADMRLVRK